jgi:hypothetical protein
MPEGFPKRELRKPPSPARLDQADREVRALEVWTESAGRIDAVMAEFDITKTQANILVNRAAEKFIDDKKAVANRLKAKQTFMLDGMIDIMHEAFRAGDFARATEIRQTWERLSKLWGLDEKREDEQVQPNWTVIVGLPDERGDVIDGTIVPNELEAPGGP